MHPTLTTISWIFTAGVLAHNAEEACLLPVWSTHAGKWYPPVGQREFRLGIAFASAIILAITTAAALSPPRSVGVSLMAGLALAMALNAILPHLLLTTLTHSYMPGTATGILLNLPLGLLYLHQAFATQAITLHTFLWAGSLTVLATLALIPALLALARATLHQD